MVKSLTDNGIGEGLTRPLLAVLAPLFLLVAASCGGGATGDGGSADEAAPDAGEEVAAAETVELEHPSLGDEDAPVVLVEYADYQ